MPEGALAGHALLATVYQEELSYQEAAAGYLKVLELDPDWKKRILPIGVFYGDLTKCLRNIGDPERARNLLQSALERPTLELNNTERAELLNHLGEMALALNRPEEAERAWRDF